MDGHGETIRVGIERTSEPLQLNKTKKQIMNKTCCVGSKRFLPQPKPYQNSFSVFKQVNSTKALGICKHSEFDMR